MSNVEYITASGDLNKAIGTAWNTFIEHLTSKFETPQDLSNSETDLACKMNESLAWLDLLGNQNTSIAKQYKQIKQEVDARLEEMGKSSEGSPGQLIELYSNNVFTLRKKQNNDTTSISSKDLIIELAKLGVDKDIIDIATKNATKKRRGNVYYQVSLNGR